MATDEIRVEQPAAGPVPRSLPRLPKWLRALLQNPLSITGLVVVTLFVLIAILAPVLAPPANPEEPFAIPRAGFGAEPQPPRPGYIFGTTQGQYDLYYGVIWGTRTAFKIGILVTALTVLIGGTLGAISGYAGGWVDELLQRIVEIFLAFPFLLAALTLAVVLAPKLHNGLLTGMVALDSLLLAHLRPVDSW